MPRFFADECLAKLIVDGLIAHGFDVADARVLCQGDTDADVLALAAAAGRVVITEDRGFAELAIRHRHRAVGVIVVVLHDLPAGQRETYAIARIAAIAEKAEGQVIVIEPERSRTRPLPPVTETGEN